MNVIGVGVALAGLLFLFPDATSQTSNWDRSVAFVVSITSAWLLASGVLHRVPLAEVELAWDERFDQLRDRTERFVQYLDNNYNTFWKGQTDFRGSWRDYIALVPIPRPDERPLHEWQSRFEEHSSRDVRQLFDFARNVAHDSKASEFRRFAVRTYDRFGKLLLARAPGFQEWIEEEDVKAGAEALLVMLAYMEVARACSVKVGRPGHLRRGFWFLSESWHPEVMALPRR